MVKVGSATVAKKDPLLALRRDRDHEGMLRGQVILCKFCVWVCAPVQVPAEVRGVRFLLESVTHGW